MGISAMEVAAAEADKKARSEILDRLAELGGNRTTRESGVAYHTGKQILLPEAMSLKQGAKLLAAQATAMEEEHEFNKVFQCRPWDGAFATQEVLKRLFGVGGQGKAQYGFFGEKYPPQYVNVEVSLGVEVRVPWGVLDFPLLEATMKTSFSNDPKKGALFALEITCPKKYESQVEGLFIAITEWLKENSIYKGKAIVGVGKIVRGQGFENPTFLDPYAIDPEKVAYRETVFERLTAAVWGPIRTAALQRKAGLKLNRKTLLEGPYGTGKSLAGGLTARVAHENGWTFIQCKTGDDDLQMVLRMAELYAPSVVFIEDIDILIETDPKKMSALLEEFDGVSSKNKEVMVLMTSNKLESLSKGMTRAGRIDAVINIGDLDAPAIRRLIHANFTPNQLSEDIDFEEIMKAMEGFEPAFIQNTFSDAKSNAVVRTGEAFNFQLNTEDFRIAAEVLRTQHDTHRAALDAPVVDSFTESFKGLVREELTGHQVDLEQEGRIVALDR